MVNGYGGYQVRDNIHADDLARAFAMVADDPPKMGEPFVTNFGGGLHSNCSMLEAISLAEQATGKKLNWTYNHTPRKGDHMWYIGSCERFNLRYGPTIHPVGGCQHVLGSTVPEDLKTTFRFYRSFEYSRTLPQIVAEIADRHQPKKEMA